MGVKIDAPQKNKMGCQQSMPRRVMREVEISPLTAHTSQLAAHRPSFSFFLTFILLHQFGRVLLLKSHA